MAAAHPPVDKSAEFTAYAALTKGVTLHPWKYHPRPLGPHDVEVKITHCGICASDLHQARDGWKSSPADHFPMVPGHEIIGNVVALGAEAKKFKIGQRVGVGTVVESCRKCEACAESEEAMCYKRTVFTYNDKFYDGSVAQGGYASHIRTDEHFVFSIPENLSSAGVAPLLCAGITTYVPFKLYNVQPGWKVGIVGIGGLGHLGIKWAAAFGTEVTAISSKPGKEEVVKKLGAKHFLALSDPEAMAKAASSLDFLLITANADNMDYDKLLGLLKNKRTACMVAVPEEKIKIEPFSIIGRSRALGGSITGGVKVTQEMLEFAGKHNIEADVEVWPASKVNEAWQGVIAGKPRFRYVLDLQK